MANRFLTVDELMKNIHDSAVKAVKELIPDTPGQTEPLNIRQKMCVAHLKVIGMAYLGGR